MAGGVPQSPHIGVGAEDRTPIRRDRAQASPGPEGDSRKLGQQPTSGRHDLMDAGVGDSPIESHVLHGAAKDCFTAAGQDVPVVVVEHRTRHVGRPGCGRHLSTDGLDRQRAGKMVDAGGPGASGDDDVLRLDLAGGDFDAGRAAEDRGEAGHPGVQRACAVALRIGVERARECWRVHGTVFRCKHRAQAGCRGGESLRHLLRFQPVATQSSLALMGHHVAEPLGFRLIECKRRDAVAPQPDVDAGVLAPTLAENTGIDIGLWRDGIASLAFDESEAERLRDVVAHQRQAGLRCDWLEAEEVAERFPATAPCLGAMFAPEDGAVDAPALARVLHADAKRLGTRTFATRVNRINTILGRVTGVEIPAGKIKAEHVVIAAGVWSTQIDHLPRRLPVEPVRGQMPAAPWQANMPRTVLYYDHSYVLARSGEAIFGSTMEHAGFDGSVTPSGIAEIMAAARRMLPQLPPMPSRTWAGLRPLTPDGRPIVGPDPDVRGLWYATGHGRNGVLLAGLTGDIIASLITTGESEVEIASLAPERFTS